MKRIYILNIFDDQTAPTGTQTTGTQPAAGAQATQQTSATVSFSFDELAEFSAARAQRAADKAERDALASMFQQQGITDKDQIQEAINDFKAKKAAQTPNLAAITRERDEALAKAAAYEQEKSLTKRGVAADDIDYVAFKVRSIVAADPEKKLTFDKAADKYLKENPRFISGTAYMVQSAPAANTTPGANNKDDKYRAMDAAIAAMFGGV